MATIHVDDDADDNDEEPYQKIQTAIDNAVTGDTIDVAAGTYDESVKINVKKLTLEGPNAGHAGDSDQRGDEASFQTGGNIDADNVTIDGFELVPRPNAGGGESRTEILGSNAVITNSDVDVPDGDAPFRLSASANDTVITQNQFANGDGGNFVINSRKDETDLIDGVEITDNTFEDITGTGTTAIQANGYTNANISGNSFDNIGEDAVRLAGDVSGTEVTNNGFSNYAQDSDIGVPAGAIIANSLSGDNIDISSNQFNDAGGDDRYVVEFSSNVLNVGDIQNNNQFDQNTQLVDVDDDGDDEAIVPDAGQDEVLNANTGERFSSVQNAVDNASTGDTIRVGPGTFTESVAINVEILTLKGPNAGLAGDSDQRGDEATITDANGRSEISAANVTIDGFNFEFGEQAIRSGGGVDSLITNSRFELTDDTSNGYAIRAEESSTGINVTDNLFTGITSNDGTGGDNANGVVVRDPNGTRIADNIFSSVDTAVNIGSKTDDTASGTVSVENNKFSGITQFGAVLVNNLDTSLDVDVNNNTIQSSEVGVFTFNANDGATFSIQDNDFQNFANDEVFVDDSAGVLTLDAVLQNNTFDRAVTVEDDSGNIIGDSIFTTIQPTIDAASDGDTVRINNASGDEEFEIDAQNGTNQNKIQIPEDLGADVSIKGSDETDNPELQVPDDGTGIEVNESDTTIRDLSIKGPSNNTGTAIDVSNSNTTIENVEIGSGSAPDTGVRINDSGCTLRDSTITVNPTAAIEIDDGDDNVIEDGTLQPASGASGGAGVLVNSTGRSGNLIALNDIDSGFDNGINIQSGAGAGNVTVRFNNLRGNKAGIKNNDNENVDARSNFWGNKTGPSGGVNDPETGRTADGDGSAIDNHSNDGKVRYDEFLEISNDFILNTGSPSSGRDTDGDGLHEDFNNDGDHFPTDGYLFLRALRQGHFDRLTAIDGPDGDLSTDYTTRFDFDGDGSDDISRSDVVSMVINRNRD